MKGVFVLILLCTTTLVCAEELNSAGLKESIQKMSDESFEVRQAAEKKVLEMIDAGHESDVLKALKAALAGPGADAELKGRADKLLKLCEATNVNGLRAQFITATPETDGMLHIKAPFDTLPEMTLQLTNTSGKAYQLAHSSYPIFAFFSLDIVRLENDGKKRIPINKIAALYPFKDMPAAEKVFETLAPGVKMERSFERLLRDGQLMVSLIAGSDKKFLEERNREGFGMLRTPGIYEVSGVYSLEGNQLFSTSKGRDESIALWSGKTIRTKPILLKVDASEIK